MQKCPICSNEMKMEHSCESCGYVVCSDFIKYRTLCAVPKKDVQNYVTMVSNQAVNVHIQEEEAVEIHNHEKDSLKESPKFSEKLKQFFAPRKQQSFKEMPLWKKIILIICFLNLFLGIVEDGYFVWLRSIMF